MKPIHKMSKQEIYLEGIRKGKEAAAEAVANGFQTGLYLALAGYYNTKPDKVIDKLFGAWSKAAEAECTRIFREIRGDYDVSKYAVVVNKTAETLEDSVHHSMIRLSELREYLGLDKL